MNTYPFKLGDVVVCRTLSFHYIGVITAIKESSVTTFITLADAYIIMDSGDWFNFLRTGKVEAGGALNQSTSINIAHCVEIVAWNHKIPK